MNSTWMFRGLFVGQKDNTLSPVKENNMKKTLFTAILISLFLGVTVISGFSASEHEAHHPSGTNAPATSPAQGMMKQQGMDMGQMPCMADKSSGSMMSMMGQGMGGMKGTGMAGMMDTGMAGMMGTGNMGMMEKRMEHMFFLDRAEELGLSADQVSKLKAIHTECRRDNIRNAAEAKIARLELADLLSGDNWTLKDAETMVRKVQKLEGDMQVRHLQAISDARKVLTTDQLKQARSDGASVNLESLFR